MMPSTTLDSKFHYRSVASTIGDFVDIVLAEGSCKPTQVTYGFEPINGRSQLVFRLYIDNSSGGMGRVIGRKHRGERALRTMVAMMVPDVSTLVYIHERDALQQQNSHKRSHLKVID